MFNHGFSDETPIEKLVESYLGIDIREKPLKKVLAAMAAKFIEKYKNLQPTYAQFSSEALKVKFRYLIDRVILKYNLDDTNSAHVKKYFWDLVDSQKLMRQAVEPWPDYELRKSAQQLKNSKINKDNLPDNH